MAWTLAVHFVDADQLEQFVLQRISAEAINARAQEFEQSKIPVQHHAGE